MKIEKNTKKRYSDLINRKSVFEDSKNEKGFYLDE